MSVKIPLYRFRCGWSLELFLKCRANEALSLRRDAAVLTVRAEQIENECKELRDALELVKDGEENQKTGGPGEA